MPKGPADEPGGFCERDVKLPQLDKQVSEIALDLIMAARPNFMKVAPLYHVLKATGWCAPRLVHTGQHYDFNMSDAFIRDLGLPTPDIHLNIGSGSHAQQTAGVMTAYEAVCERDRPSWIVVVGDVNSTLACALVAAKLCIPLAHLEAGLRSGDRTMPEEVNRIVTDRLADVLWTPSPDADANLRAEGIEGSRISHVGNIMIDAYEMLRPRIESAGARDALALPGGRFGVVTLHRPSNVDVARQLGLIVDALIAASALVPLVFPIHPRTAAKLRAFGLWQRLEAAGGIRLLEPLGYVDFMSLVTGSLFVVTDSGGLQEEATYLDIPCLTLRASTERPVTVTQGSNALVSPDQLVASVPTILEGSWKKSIRPQLWDGRAADRIAADLAARTGRR